MGEKNTPAYWINTVSKDHVVKGVEGGFTQANHGRQTTLKRMKCGDWLVFYSPKVTFEGNERLQKFTAIGQITDDEPYQYAMSDTFEPFRRNVTFYPCNETAIRPLIGQLSFIHEKERWRYMFRFGLFNVPKEDFAVIAEAMDADRVTISSL